MESCLKPLAIPIWRTLPVSARRDENNCVIFKEGGREKSVELIDMAHEHRFELIEHTADVGVIGKGRTMAEAFENIAYGMFSLMADLAKYKPTKNEKVVVTGTDDEMLLERFLSELIVIFDGDRLLPIDIEITEISMGRLTCWISARPIGDDIEWLGPTVKAVTYHQMAVENKDGEWSARAIFDV